MTDLTYFELQAMAESIRREGSRIERARIIAIVRQFCGSANPMPNRIIAKISEGTNDFPALPSENQHAYGDLSDAHTGRAET